MTGVVVAAMVVVVAAVVVAAVVVAAIVAGFHLSRLPVASWDQRPTTQWNVERKQ